MKPGGHYLYSGKPSTFQLVCSVKELFIQKLYSSVIEKDHHATAKNQD